MRPAVSQVCSLGSSFEKDLEDYSAAACKTIELWLPKLEAYLETHTLADAIALRDAQGVTFPVAAGQGGLLVSQGEARRLHWEHFRRRLDLCRQLGVETIVIGADIRQTVDETDLERIQVSLVEAAQAAAAQGLRVAVEFQHGNTFLNNLQTAALLIHELAQPNLGICFDIFHWAVGPSKLEDIGLLTPSTLFHVQLCDLSGILREFAADADRILPGDGDLPIAPLADFLRETKYDGVVSVEVMNPLLAGVSPRSLAEIAVTALRKSLGLASRGQAGED